MAREGLFCARASSCETRSVKTKLVICDRIDIDPFQERVSSGSFSEAAIFWASILSMHWTRLRRHRSTLTRVQMYSTRALRQRSALPITRLAQEVMSKIWLPPVLLGGLFKNRSVHFDIYTNVPFTNSRLPAAGVDIMHAQKPDWREVTCLQCACAVTTVAPPPWRDVRNFSLRYISSILVLRRFLV